MHLLYVVWEVDPRIFPPLELLRWYGLFWALGLWLSIKLMAYVFEKEGRETGQLERLSIYLILGALIGARLGHVLFYDPFYYWQHPIEVLPIKLEPHLQFTGLAGLASHGGAIGALLALFFYCRRYNKNALWLLDRLVIAGALLGGFIRLGNLMNSEIVGEQTHVPWAFIFTRVDALPRHPAQLYEAAFYFTLFVLLFWLWKRGFAVYRQGFLIGLGMMAVFCQRFLVEFLKVNQVPFEAALPFNMGQFLSIPFALLGAWFLLRSLRQEGRQELPSDRL